jgi:uncharacterized membrane protein YeaQ/YmgE (transglycosylase-associated protein family)
MSLLLWMLFGIVIGLCCTFLLKDRDAGMYIATMTLGLMGSMVAGFIGAQFGLGSVSSFEWLSLLPAAGGSILFLGTFMIARRPRRY